MLHLYNFSEDDPTMKIVNKSRKREIILEDHFFALPTSDCSALLLITASEKLLIRVFDNALVVTKGTFFQPFQAGRFNLLSLLNLFIEIQKLFR